MTTGHFHYTLSTQGADCNMDYYSAPSGFFQTTQQSFNTQDSNGIQYGFTNVGDGNNQSFPVSTWAVPTSTAFGTYNVPTSNFGPIGQPVPSRVIPALARIGNPRLKLKPKPIGPRLIKATEIKAWLFEWCTQKKMKPTYSFESKGKYPKVKYICTLSIDGIEYRAISEARNKKDAQTLCAWDFCNQMVVAKKIDGSNLPKREAEVEKTSILPPTPPIQNKEAAKIKTPEAIGLEENGGWSVENARRRLNNFCMEERISCDFETSTQGGNIYSMKGAYLSHSATSKLVLNIKRLGEPLVQISTASNKKAANAQCALKMVGELYRRNLIERFGEEKIQKPLSPTTMSGENESIGEKRKIEGEEEPVQFDENGNWTLELARSRLSEFYQKQEKQLNCDEREYGSPFQKQFECSCSIVVAEKKFSAKATASSKKGAQKKCALDMVIQLYKAGFIPGNPGRRNKDLINKRQKKDSMSTNGASPVAYPISIPKQGTTPGRTTPFDDRHIGRKLELLEAEDEEKLAVRNHFIIATTFIIRHHKIKTVTKSIKR